MAEGTDRNPVVVVFNIVCVLIEFLLVQIKFWIKVCEEIYVKFSTLERDVSRDVVLVTGAGHGMGRELAIQYAQLGATVVCWDINEQLNLDTVKEIKSKGRKAFGYVVDVTNRELVLATAAKVLSQVGDVTILVNNAGIMPAHDLLEHTEAEIKRIFDINVLAHFWMLHAFLPKMIEKNRGHIVAMSSMAGVLGFKNLVPYCGSKFAVRGIMESTLEELRCKKVTGIFGTTVYPYMVDTGLCKKVSIRFADLFPMVKPDEAAATIISAQRRNVMELSIPGHLLYMNTFFRQFPSNACLLIKDFFDTNVESDL